MDSIIHLADSRLDMNVVQHAVLMAVGNKTAIKEAATKGRTGQAEYDQHPVNLWIVNCSFSSNTLVVDTQLQLQGSPSETGAGGVNATTASGAAAGGVVAGNANALVAAAATIGMRLRKMEAGDILDSSSMRLLPLPPEYVAEGSFINASDDKECRSVMDKLLEKLQRGIPSKRHQAVLWANVGRFLLEEVSMDENSGFPFVLRVDSGMQYYKQLQVQHNQVHKSVLDTWYADVAVDGAKVLGNLAGDGPLLQVLQSRFSARQVRTVRQWSAG